MMTAKIPISYRGAGHVLSVGPAACLFVQGFTIMITQALPEGEGEE